MSAHCRRLYHDFLLLCLCEHGHGERHFAGGGRALAFGQLWRHGHLSIMVMLGMLMSIGNMRKH
jgi:hypothetical protein